MKKNGLTRKTLFIADPSPLIITSLTETFSEDQGLKIIGTAENVETAIQSIKQLKPDILILDVQFKEGTGLDILNFIRENHYQTIVCFFTRSDYPELKEHCYEAGTDLFFKKPQEHRKMVDEIRKMRLNEQKKIK